MYTDKNTPNMLAISEIIAQDSKNRFILKHYKMYN